MTQGFAKNKQTLHLAAAWLVLGVCTTSPAQAVPSTALPSSRFEVASVRMAPADHGLFTISPDGAPLFVVTNVSLTILIQMAYGVEHDQISGAPEWLDTQYYDVSAKPEGDVGLTREQLKPQLQQLLIERFHLATHRQKKELAGYALTLGKGGFKLEPSQGKLTGAYWFSTGIQIPNTSLQTLASILGSVLSRPIVDKTGVSGNYDFKLSFAPEGSEDSSLPSIFTALQEQFGLKLTSQKVLVDMLVLDHVDRVPSEN